MRHLFPSIHFGICRKCGRGLTESGGTSADAPARYTEKRGIKLKYFRGEWWCDICIEDEKSDEYSERVADFTNREQEFRSNAGFVKTIT